MMIIHDDKNGIYVAYVDGAVVAKSKSFAEIVEVLRGIGY